MKQTRDFKHLEEKKTAEIDDRDFTGFDEDTSFDPHYILENQYKEKIYIYMEQHVDKGKPRRRCSTEDFVMHYESLKDRLPDEPCVNIYIELTEYYTNNINSHLKQMPDYLKKELNVYGSI